MEPRHRVVVYQLDDSSQWTEIGMGYCDYESEGNDSSRILVHSESDRNTFFTVHIQSDIVYRQEQETIIAWSDPDGCDYALSFEDSIGCERYWSIIHNIQTAALSGNDSDPSSSNYEQGESPQRNQVELPFVELKNLQEIEAVITHSNYTWVSRLALARSLLSENYVEKLFDIFDIADDLEIKEDLHRLYNIFKQLVLMHNADIMEHFLKDENIIRFVAVFEYDPAFPSIKASYSAFLREKASFKEIVPISNADIKNRIHVAFRAQYLKDVVLPRILNDESFLLLNNIIRTNYQQILERLESDTEFLGAIAELMKADTADEPTHRSLVAFMKEMFMMLKTLSREGSLTKLFKLDVLLEFLNVLFVSKNDVELLSSITDLFISILTSYAVEMREFILASSKVSSLASPTKILPQLIDIFKVCQDHGLRAQCAQILRLLLTSTPADIRSDDFLSLFYTQYANSLFAPLSDLGKMLPEKDAKLNDESMSKQQIELGSSSSDLYYHLCGLLGTFVTQHTYRVKYIILGGTILKNVLVLTKAKEKYLLLASLRLFRTVISLCDEFYNRYIIKNQLFLFIFPLLDHYVRQDNLVSSALLELFEFIRAKNMKLLLDHLVDHHGDRLKPFEELDLFKRLMLRYHQNHDTSMSTAAATSLVASGGSQSELLSAVTPIEAARSKKLSSDMTDETLTTYRHSATSSVPRELPLHKAREGWSSSIDADEESYFSSADDDSDSEPFNEASENSTVEREMNGKESEAPAHGQASSMGSPAAASHDTLMGSPTLGSPLIEFVKPKLLSEEMLPGTGALSDKGLASLSDHGHAHMLKEDQSLENIELNEASESMTEDMTTVASENVKSPTPMGKPPLSPKAANVMEAEDTLPPSKKSKMHSIL